MYLKGGRERNYREGRRGGDIGRTREGRREVEVRGRGKEIKLKKIEEKERWIEGEKQSWEI